MPEQMRVLYLHGYAQNADIAQMQLTLLEEVMGKVETVEGFLHVKAEDMDGVGSMSAEELSALKELANDTKLRGWWIPSKVMSEEAAGQQQATTKMIEYINNASRKAPVDGLVRSY